MYFQLHTYIPTVAGSADRRAQGWAVLTGAGLVLLSGSARLGRVAAAEEPDGVERQESQQL